MRPRYLTALFLSALSFAYCTPQKDLINYSPEGDNGKDAEFRPLDDSGQYAEFHLETSPDAIMARTGEGFSFSLEDKIYSRMETFSPVFGEDGTCSVKVPSSKTHNYRLFLYPGGEMKWYMEEAPLHGLMIPYSQFLGTTLAAMSSFPLYGEYSSETGSTIIFREVFAAVELSLEGDASISSIHLENKNADPSSSVYLAGLADFDPEKGYEVTKGVNFVNLNCMDRNGKGAALGGTSRKFYLVLSPGNYSKGLTLSVSDTRHKAVDYDIPPFEIKAGELRSLGSFRYEPASDVLLYERFDNFVWGGNVRDSEGTFSSFAPDSNTSPDDAPASRSGFEDAFTRVSTNTAGSAMIQSTYTAGYTVQQRHAVSSDYIASRNIGDYNYLYRCQEFQGCISAGAGDAVRGMVDLVRFEKLNQGLYKAIIEFDVAFRYGTTDDFAIQISKSGIVRSVTVDGEPMELETTLDGNNTHNHSFVSRCLMTRKNLLPPSTSGDALGWHHVKIEAWNLCEVSVLSMLGATTDASLKHGFFIDNICVRAEEMPKGNLRVLFMNIQNGMWADEPNNYDNFVSWVRKYDPDVCVWCEARTLYKPGTSTAVSSDAERKLCRTMGSASDDGWRDLAARYGHQYYAISGFRDNYPQVITSRYPITTLGRYTDAGSGLKIQHGAGMFSVEIAGKTIKVVSLHLWPQIYSPSSNTAASAAALEGRDHQVKEIDAILKQTSPSASDYFLMMGDHNAITRQDAWYYEPNNLYEVVTAKWKDTPIEFTDGKYREKWYQAHDKIIANGAYDDMLVKFWPGKFMSSTGGSARIDFMYGSPAMTEKLVNMTTIHDSWSTIVSGTAPFAFPSDHLPILADFNL